LTFNHFIGILWNGKELAVPTQKTLRRFQNINESINDGNKSLERAKGFEVSR